MITVYDLEGKPIQLDGVDARERIAAGLATETITRKPLEAPVSEGRKKIKDNKTGKETTVNSVDANERVKAGLATFVPEDDPDELDDSPDTPSEHENPLVDAICRMDRNDKSLWMKKGVGAPTVQGLSEEAKIECSADERNHAWDEYLDFVDNVDGG